MSMVSIKKNNNKKENNSQNNENNSMNITKKSVKKNTSPSTNGDQQPRSNPLQRPRLRHETWRDAARRTCPRRRILRATFITPGCATLRVAAALITLIGGQGGGGRCEGRFLQVEKGGREGEGKGGERRRKAEEGEKTTAEGEDEGDSVGGTGGRRPSSSYSFPGELQ